MATAASTHSVPVRSREGTITHIADRVSYWLISAGIYFTFGLLFYYSAKEKLIDNSGTMPAGLAKTFHGTFVASFPGTNTSWVLIGLLEALVFVVIVGQRPHGRVPADPPQADPAQRPGALDVHIRDDRLGREHHRRIRDRRRAVPVPRRDRRADRPGAADAALPQERLALQLDPARRVALALSIRGQSAM